VSTQTLCLPQHGTQLPIQKLGWHSKGDQGLSGYYESARISPRAASLSSIVRNYNSYPEQIYFNYEGSGGSGQEQRTFSYRSGKGYDSEANLETESYFEGGHSGETLGKLAAGGPGYYHSRFAGSNTDNGHEFWTDDKYQTPAPISAQWLYWNTPHSYVGDAYLAANAPGSDLYGSFKSFNSDSYGTTGVNKTIPTHPGADWAVTLAELKREGFPIPFVGKHSSAYAVNDIRDVPQAVGSDYLAMKFGVEPFSAAVSDTTEVFAKWDKILTQMRRDSGRNIRRSYRFPVENERIDKFKSSVSANYVGDGFSNPFSQPRGNLTSTWLNEYQYKFTAAYTYVLPTEGSKFDAMKRAEAEFDMAFGSRFDAAALWNITPWSWLADWNANLGEIIENADALNQHGLVLRFGYITRIATSRGIHRLYPVKLKGESTYRTLEFETYRRRVDRVRANPFGFDLDIGDYSPMKWSILGALGLANGITNTLIRK
jgi:hypothetical protein